MKIFLKMIMLIIAIIILAGIYKFNYLSSLDGYDVDGNKIELKQIKNEEVYQCGKDTSFSIFYNQYKKRALAKDEVIFVFQNKEVVFIKDTIHSKLDYISEDKKLKYWRDKRGAFIVSDEKIYYKECQMKVSSILQTYFDIKSNKWMNKNTICKECTKENGYLKKGQMKNQAIAIWQEIQLKLKNDLGETPPINEVLEIFAYDYNLDYKWFGTYVSLDNDIFTIIYPFSKSLDEEYLNPRGKLKAYYEVMQINKSR